MFAALGEAIGEAPTDPYPLGDTQPKSFPTVDVYETRAWGAYTRGWRWDDPSNQWVRRDDVDVRRGELKLDGFMATNARVYGADFALRGYLQYFAVQASWERFFEPRPEIGSTDTLDLFRLRMGPNVFGSMLRDAEVYLLFGGSVMKGQNAPVAAADIGIEGRAYPLRPFALYGSAYVSFFAEGPPLLDGRFEGGVSLGRFDLRGGLRMLKQEPDQSFFGPTASITMRF